MQLTTFSDFPQNFSLCFVFLQCKLESCTVFGLFYVIYIAYVRLCGDEY